MTTTRDTEGNVPERDEIEELRRQVAELRVVVDRLSAAPRSSDRLGAEPSRDHAAGAPGTTRRDMLRRSAIAAGAGVAGAIAVAKPAVAVDPNDIEKDVENLSSGTTSLVSSGADADAFWGVAIGPGASYGLRGSSTGSSGIGVFGSADSDTGATQGVAGQCSSPDGAGVSGFALSASGTSAAAGVRGETLAGVGAGVHGVAAVGQSNSAGVRGEADVGTAVFGESDSGVGVLGRTSGDSVAVLGQNFNTSTGTGVYGSTEAPNGAGVQGLNVATSGGAVGVRGVTSSPGGTGVAGSATVGGATGVAGNATGSGTGVRATGVDGPGLRAESISRPAVIASSGTGVGITLVSKTAAAYLAPNGVAPQLRADEHFEGEIYLDDAHELWLCVADGTPGTWARLTPEPKGSVAQVFPVDPFRVYDARFVDGPLVSGADRVISVADAIDPFTGSPSTSDSVPVGATAIMFNLTITNTTDSGFLAVTPGDAANFGASSINWSTTGQTIANGTVVQLDGDRQVKVFSGGGGAADFIVDVTAYVM